MKELQEYVDKLFRYQRQTVEVKDLKEEILSNMTAKYEDFLTQGINKVSAIEKAEDNIVSIEGLIDGNQLTYIDRYHTECLQTALLNSTIFWICTLPLLVMQYALLSFCGLLATVLLGIAYIVKLKQQSNEVSFISVTANEKRRKWAWIIWVLFFLVYIGSIAAATFASNIWFSQPLNITGPYQFLNIVIRFYIPLLTVVVPVTIGSFTKLLIKNEKRYEDE